MCGVSQDRPWHDLLMIPNDRGRCAHQVYFEFFFFFLCAAYGTSLDLNGRFAVVGAPRTGAYVYERITSTTVSGAWVARGVLQPSMNARFVCGRV